MLAPISERAARAGKHVLVEKPAGRRAAELDPVIAAAEAAGVRVRVGFNHRYHPALIEARKIVDSGVAGPLMIVRGRYGHGGRPKDRDWRAIAEVSGGGEAIDQGMHLIDLSRWFLGDFSSVQGAVPTCFWNMEVEDNAFFLLKTDRGQYAQLHASWTEWKNMFGLEIYGRVGKIDISGLGGSYGEEKLTYYQMVEGQEKPDKRDVTFDKEDKSWYVEFEEFMRDINEGRDPNPGLRDAQAALRIVETVYKEQGR